MTLQNPLSTTLQELGRNLLEAAKQQAENLGNSQDSEALHDFRVSSRRLRSFLKSFEPYLENAKKYRQKLSDIMTLTNAGRDIEVHIAWLKTRQAKANEVEHIGLSYLLEQFSSHEHVDLKKVHKQFSEVAKKLGKVLSSDKHFKVKPQVTFAAVSADILKTHAEHLQKLLQDIKSPEDEVIHEARIIGKRLRYTLELLDTQGASTLVKQLKTFQDTTGDLHDLQVLEPKVQTFVYAETLLWSQAFRNGAKTLSHDALSKLPELQRSYGLAEVARELEQGKTSLYNDLQTDWLAEAGNDFFRDLETFINKLASEQPPVTSSPKKSRKKALTSE